ncbi:aspartate-semialdehyde dehydrogenase, partial [bacterium]|nr:aspartate-semialdehyde dehydrogenase [bacterium]
MKKPNIAILGATGVVGREITKITEGLNIDFNSIKFLSSAKSAGSKITFKNKEYTVEEATPE